MNRYRIFIQIIIIGIVSFIAACDHLNDSISQHQPKNSGDIIDEAKAYFENYYIRTTLLRNSVDKKDKPSLIPLDFVLLWDEALIRINEEIAYVDIPIRYTSNRFIAKTISAEDGKINTYKTDLMQKLRIVKNLSSANWTCHAITFIYNPQNEMFEPFETKRSFPQNETLLKTTFPAFHFRPAYAGI